MLNGKDKVRKDSFFVQECVFFSPHNTSKFHNQWFHSIDCRLFLMRQLLQQAINQKRQH